MNTCAVLLLLFISALPLSKNIEENLEKRVVNSKLFGKELRIEVKERNKEGRGEAEGFVLSPLPYKKQTYTDFSPWSRATKTIDLSTSEILFEKNAGEKLQIASLTKLMTAIVAYENADIGEVVTIPQLNPQSGESTMSLQTGDKVKVGELLHGLLINSAGDAAQSLSIHISGSEEKFVDLMNKRAGEMMLIDTHFSNSSGYLGTDNYSTANDMINLSRLFIRNDYLKSIVSKSVYEARSESGKVYSLKTTNKLLDNKRVFGVKTGYTPLAGECLITLAKEQDHEILTIVLGSSNRFTETNNLINWISTNFGW